MTQAHFKSLEAAYQLHFYLAFKTPYLRPLLKGKRERILIGTVLDEVCARQQYHMLYSDVSDNYLRMLLSLKPEQSISQAVKYLKGNLSVNFGRTFRLELEQQRTRTLWAKGYFARSSGKVNLEAARNYVETQTTHHGYKGEWTKPLKYRNPDFRSPAFSLPHSVCMLDYHLVLVTKFRAQLFDEAMAPGLFNYVLTIGRKHGFAVERMSLLPDHLHLLIQAIPGLSIYECALALLNNSQRWMEKHYWGALKQMDAWDVWQPSFYAGTVGEYTTAQVKSFLRS